MQLLNVGLGGSLWQDLGHRDAEPEIPHEDRFSVDRPVHENRVEEPTLLYGVEFRPRDESAPWIAGVPWHPERMIGEGSGTHRRLFRRFGRVVRGAA